MTQTVKETSAVRTRYVLTVVVNPHTRQAIGIVKLKGPAHLWGRVSFPGGRITPGETPEQAASRELFEEAGVHVPESDWKQVSRDECGSGELNVLAALSERVEEARKKEEEPILILKVDPELERAHAWGYAYDFAPILRASLRALGLL